MSSDPTRAVQIKPLLTVPTRHPIKAARLLYTAPSYVLRGPIYLVLLILLVGLLYSFWAKKDVLVMAPLVLQKDSFTMPATGQGVVLEIDARENSFIRFGDQLAVIQEHIDPFNQGQRDAFAKEIKTLMDEKENVQKDYGYQIDQLESQIKDLTSNKDVKVKELDARIDILRKQVATAQSSIGVASSAAATARAQFARISQLYNTHDVPITQFEAAREAVNRAEKAVFDAQQSKSEIEIQLKTATVERESFGSQEQVKRLEGERDKRKADLARALEKLDSKIGSINERLNKAMTAQEGATGATYQEDKIIYSSLFDGLITKVHAQTGQIITPGSPLVTMIRESAALEGHAFVDNKDIGHLRLGQVVKIKYFAYPYQEYGIKEGQISDIATTPSGLPGKESKYLVKIALLDETIRSMGGKPKPLEMGLEGIAEIKTGEKRFIEIIFSPISKFLGSKEG
jgi:multidrug resistance efflux pump